MRYYPIQQRWPSIRRHLSNPEFQRVLVRDMRKFRAGFVAGMKPHEADGCDWTAEYRAKNRATGEVIPIEPKRAKKSAKKVSGWLAGALTLSPSASTRATG